MLYRKNIYAWEQWSRVLLGAALAVWGLGFAPAPWNWLALVAAAGAIVTGIFGWCPACAMIGRRIKERP